MIKFCRNCGKVLSDPADKTCHRCDANAAKASAYCRYCGNPTNFQDLVCNNCGSAIKPTPVSIRLLNPDHRKLIKLGKIINLSIVGVMVAAYTVFVLPEKVMKPIKQASSDVVLASTGYTGLPLHSISVVPPIIPQLANYGQTYVPPGITVNSTRQLTVYAVYKNLTSINSTKAVRFEDVTENCTYSSGNETIATVNISGTVKATGPGTTSITVSYTAAPGTANLSNASLGKIPVTFTTAVTVIVR